MELHRNTTDAFINYLKQHGYPEESIVFEWGTRMCAIDIAIVADDYKTPVAIFEIKGKKTPQTIRVGVEQLTRASQMLNLTVPCSLVFGLDHEPFFEVIEVSDIVYKNAVLDEQTLMENQPLTKPLSYNNIRSGALVKVNLLKQREKQKRIDRLKPVCWVILPIIATIILFLDERGFYILNTERLAVLGVITLIILVPFFSEITIQDLSLKREKIKSN